MVESSPDSTVPLPISRVTSPKALVVAAWVSVFADSYRCEGCKRKHYICPMRQGNIDEARKRLKHGAYANPMDEADYSGVCPRMFVTTWTGYVMKARRWWETGQLGIDFLRAPVWVGDAFAILDSQVSEALTEKHRRDSKRKG